TGVQTCALPISSAGPCRTVRCLARLEIAAAYAWSEGTIRGIGGESRPRRIQPHPRSSGRVLAIVSVRSLQWGWFLCHCRRAMLEARPGPARPERDPDHVRLDVEASAATLLKLPAIPRSWSRQCS